MCMLTMLGALEVVRTAYCAYCQICITYIVFSSRTIVHSVKANEDRPILSASRR